MASWAHTGAHSRGAWKTEGILPWPEVGGKSRPSKALPQLKAPTPED
jgi:hypothetical protein